VLLACERHFRDLASGAKRGLRWNPVAALGAIRFFRYLRHSKGEWGGQPFELQPWQQFTVGSVFGWKRADGTRRFRVVYEELPRKNGKSTKLAGVGLYGLVADREPGAEVYAAATKRDQARIIFSEAQRMVSASPELRDAIRRFKSNLSVEESASKFEPLSADERTLGRIGVLSGLTAPNEWRRSERLPPVPGGDEVRAPVNLAALGSDTTGTAPDGAGRPPAGKEPAPGVPTGGDNDDAPEG
jgi:Phage Terminase